MKNPNCLAHLKADYLPKMRELLDEADLPAFLGGTDESCDFLTERGPWAEHLPDVTGGVVPPPEGA